MLKQIFRIWRCIATGVISVSLLVACAPNESCDLTKELDLTISVGKDLAFPIGSTGKIMLSDLIDPTDIDILEVDTVTGDYSLVKSETISPVKFSVGTLDFSIAAASESQHFELKLMELPDTTNLPSWIIEEMKKMKYPYVAKENVEYVTSFDVSPNVPSEIKKLRHISLANNVKLEFELKVYSEEHESDDVLELAQNIHFESDEADGLVVHLPQYLVLDRKSVV